MFGRRELRISVAKKNGAIENPIDERESLDPEKINELLKDQVRNAAIAAVVVIGVSFFLHTISEIAINAAKPKNR